ncbi:MAG: RidA family protein [Kiritimatiellae bacterium]|nr:RidA family protein [Kiritimatiellia bacterium]
MNKTILTSNAAQPIGPYNQAVAHGDLIYTSGQIPVDPATGQMVTGDIRAQTEVVLQNLKAILEAAGSGMNRVLKTTVFLQDMNDFAAMNEVYGKVFADKATAPARSTIQVARLPKDAKVEIEAVASL